MPRKKRLDQMEHLHAAEQLRRMNAELDRLAARVASGFGVTSPHYRSAVKARDAAGKLRSLLDDDWYTNIDPNRASDEPTSPYYGNRPE